MAVPTSSESAALSAISLLGGDAKVCFEEVFRIQKETTALEKNYEQQLREIVGRYEAQYRPLYEKRVEVLGQFGALDGFWLAVLQSDTDTHSYVFPQDELLLRHLTDIRCLESPHDSDYTLQFFFAPNDLIADPVLTKRFIHDEEGELLRAEGCEIHWKGEKLTEKTVKKKKSRKGKTVMTTKVVDNPSFFGFFKTSVRTEDLEEGGEEGDDGEPASLQMLEEDEELGTEIRYEIIPYALLYFLKVRTDPESSDSSSEEEPAETEASNPNPPSANPPADAPKLS